jgi:MYXO-CTERM domain-containing protein
MDPPVFPVLADGVFEHTAPFSGPQSIDITLPNDVTCTNCTLQIIQFMSNHALNNPGGCYYHHCATIAIQTEPVMTTSSTTTSGAGGNTSGNGGASNTGGSGQSGGADGTDGDEDGGCSCALIGTDRRAGAAWLALGAFALLALGRRRRR